jgi:negative regulator of sigma E activity
MTQSLQEQLSACLDGELPEAELDLLLQRLEREAMVEAGDSAPGNSAPRQHPRHSMRSAMGRYSLIGEALRTQHPVRAPADFASRVRAAVAAEEQLQAPPVRAKIAPQTLRWLRPVGGMAVAASVAAVALMAFQPQTHTPDPLSPAPASPLQAANVAPVEDNPSYVVPSASPNLAIQSVLIPPTRLTNYVVAHSEYASPLGRRTVLSGVLADEDPGQDDVPVPTDPNEAVATPADSQRP